ncbi:MAG: hypothetical protein EOO05_06195 [Chitinophagaceae bacterium]|nr:MAG: hypothetical protein EOO05_06195 [Chitinophagaceae bacterium]
MKKGLVLFGFSLFFVAIANAQLQSGNVLVGGNIANFNLGLNKGSVYNIQLQPKAAWFVSDNFAVGAYVNFGISGAKDAPTTTTYGVGPLARYYLGESKMNVLKHGRWFAEGNAGIGGTNTSKGGNSTNGLDLGVGPGYAYFITPNIGLETLLKYNGTVGFGNETYSNNLGLSVGFQIYLPGRATKKRIMREEKM